MFPDSNGANYKSGDKEPIAELNLTYEAFGGWRDYFVIMCQLKWSGDKNRFFPNNNVYNV